MLASKIRSKSIGVSANLLQALKKMDKSDVKLLIVLKNNGKYHGLISIGDIQRAIINSFPLDAKITLIIRQHNRIASPDDDYEVIKKMMYKFRMELCPVVNSEGEIIDVLFWEDVFQNKKPEPKERFNLPVVIMAGGLGTRLKPLTNVLPKPLIPIGDNTIIEDIFNRFHEHGCDRFHVSVNYKAEFIEYYLRNQNLPYHLDFLLESKPLGTAGSLSLLNGKIEETFFVSNCDILIEQDYSEILDYHQSNNNEITIIAALKHFPIAYGTIETDSTGNLDQLHEKPELTFKINSGMYVLEPHLIDEIPRDKFFHITDLIGNVKNRQGKVGVFPVSEKSWKDIGNWSEYNEMMRANL